MNAPEQTVFVVDDDAAYLVSLERLLRASGYTVACFMSASAFLSQRPSQASGCVVADLKMPGMDGLALQSALSDSDDPLPIVFLSGHGDIPTSVRAIQDGAEDFLVKTAPSQELLAAIDRALARNIREWEERARRRDLRARFASLTPREQDILTHIIRGRLNKQIAADLGIDERTVKRHRAKMMTKLSATSLAELVQIAVETGVRGSDERREGKTGSETR